MDASDTKEMFGPWEVRKSGCRRLWIGEDSGRLCIDFQDWWLGSKVGGAIE